MTTRTRAGLLWLAVLTLPAWSGGPPHGKAMRLIVREPAFGGARVSMAKSNPPRFRLHLEREMPTPGWKITIDGIDVDGETHRIVVRVTEEGPAGMVAQVLTPTSLELELGVLEPGNYILELWSRGDPAVEHLPAQAFVLRALE